MYNSNNIQSANKMNTDANAKSAVIEIVQ